ncbi:FeoB small GTPase domain-containing protein [Halobacillus sp. A5]|uniref:FeoB small GTPase domain-containing protein n=1 Tax=Halobacillus sp. A5 TaxID=2880263 RepID=UPI0020A63483|nr:FeoB small GTPase domain-containing protein [Halobacillus sp. A5]MCP3027781.1 50S ribosome-binding GTPase [Halobacillus sp. A5]
MSDFRIALAGNPNTGKSTLFNALTGMNQHTGNWPGKTVIQAKGNYTFNEGNYTLIDLPGTYSLYSNSADEETARDYIIFDRPDVTVVVVDATSLERNLNLVLQVLEMTDQAVLCINLIDEAKKRNIRIYDDRLEKKLGIPVASISARNKAGINLLLKKIEGVAKGEIVTSPYQVKYSEQMEEDIQRLEPYVSQIVKGKYPTRWVTLKLLDGDRSFMDHLYQRVFSEGDVSHV